MKYSSTRTHLDRWSFLARFSRCIFLLFRRVLFKRIFFFLFFFFFFLKNNTAHSRKAKQRGLAQLWSGTSVSTLTAATAWGSSRITRSGVITERARVELCRAVVVVVAAVLNIYIEEHRSILPFSLSLCSAFHSLPPQLPCVTLWSCLIFDWMTDGVLQSQPLVHYC